jgi:dihydroflavonol-4-reductase
VNAPSSSIVLSKGDRVVVTGAAGFIGSAITRALLERGADVVATVEPGSDGAGLRGLDVRRTALDVRDRQQTFAVIRGARAVFHLAAVYRFWAPDPAIFYEVNVVGSRNVVEAAVAAGVEGIVYTGTVGTVGLDSSPEGRPSDERDYARVARLHGPYKQSKYVAEHEVLRAAAQGAPVTIVMPTFPLGPRDARPTPTGKLVLDFLNGRLPGFVDTAMNVAHVDDLARCHLLALERGRFGRSYIAGGENLTMRELLVDLAACTGLPPPAWRFPRVVGLGVGLLSNLVEGRLLGRDPSVPLEAARTSTSPMLFDDSRAREELGYASRPAAEAIASSARWYVENGYVRPGRYARISMA